MAPAKKTTVTRTYGPIHFEDLDPHRFEDLIRQLLYDYKDWQKIEATGRSGNENGFDIRAYEKTNTAIKIEDEEPHPMDGNLWMIQVKREKTITPAKIKTILEDVDSKNPPHGYILAASATISKDSRDIFQEELRKKGVQEFYIWAKEELEDMLCFPKNDRILFTFFGISLVSKRRTMTTEIKSNINMKNKLFKCLGKRINHLTPIFVRDLKDTHYPYEDKYPDFEKKPHWKKYNAFGHHPLGLLCHVNYYYGYIDMEKKEWDIAQQVDLCEEDVRLNKGVEIELIKDFFDFLPRKNQAYINRDGLIKYSDIAIIDDKGDSKYNYPHIYIDFTGKNGPFSKFAMTTGANNEEIYINKNFKRVNKFPKKFEKIKIGKVYKDKKIILNNESINKLHEAIYVDNEEYSYLKPRDVMAIDNPEGTHKINTSSSDFITIDKNTEEIFIQITHVYKAKTIDIMRQSPMHTPFITRATIELQLGRMPNDEEELNVYEFKRLYNFNQEEK